MSDEDSELSSSKLGTLEHWESAYEKEIENFESFGDEGEVWFGSQTVKRVVNWLNSQTIDKSSVSVLDVGCGNGFTCCRLAEEGFKHVTGIDYSEKAVELSRSIALKKNLDIDYQVIDVLDEKQYSDKMRKFDIGIDKGTYDAIALCPDDSKTKRHLYKSFLTHVLKSPDSIFIITSCNWTREELLNFFTRDKEFEFIEEIKPKTEKASFTFGGKAGATTTTIVFKRL